MHRPSLLVVTARIAPPGDLLQEPDRGERAIFGFSSILTSPVLGCHLWPYPDGMWLSHIG